MNVRVQGVGQKLVDPAELRRESADRAAEQSKSDNATPKVATTMAKSISEKSGWEGKTGGSDPMNNRHFGRNLVHDHGKNSSSDVPAPTAFESDINHDPRERSSGRKLRK